MNWSFFHRKSEIPFPSVTRLVAESGEVGREDDRVYRMRSMIFLMRRVQQVSGDNDALEADRLDIMSKLKIAYDSCSEDDIELCQLFIHSVMSLARFLGFRNELDERVRWGKAALEIAELIQDQLAITELCASTISWPLLQQGKGEEAERYSLRGLEAARRCDDPMVAAKWAGNAARTLSGVARDRNDGETAYYWAGQVAEYAASCKDPLLIRGAELDFGYAALLRGDFLEAENRFQALATFEDSKEAKDIERIANRNGDVALAIMNQAIRATDDAERVRLCLRARAIWERCRQLGEEINHRVVVAEAEGGLAIVARELGDADEYERLIASCHRRFAELGISRGSRAEQFIAFPAAKKE
jgi:hypothetical protein